MIWSHSKSSEIQELVRQLWLGQADLRSGRFMVTDSNQWGYVLWFLIVMGWQGLFAILSHVTIWIRHGEMTWQTNERGSHESSRKQKENENESEWSTRNKGRERNRKSNYEEKAWKEAIIFTPRVVFLSTPRTGRVMKFDQAICSFKEISSIGLTGRSNVLFEGKVVNWLEFIR
jgi:hypothetical protein